LLYAEAKIKLVNAADDRAPFVIEQSTVFKPLGMKRGIMFHHPSIGIALASYSFSAIPNVAITGEQVLDICSFRPESGRGLGHPNLHL
jgi:hypothetical protein